MEPVAAVVAADVVVAEGQQNEHRGSSHPARRRVLEEMGHVDDR